MAKTVKFEVDERTSTIRLDEGKLFLGTVATISLGDWEVDSPVYIPVLTIFAPGGSKALAQSVFSEGRLLIALDGEELRKCFHGSTALHQFRVYLNQKSSTDGGETWKWKPDVDAVGNISINWSPEVFDAEAGSVASMEGQPGAPGMDGKSAYEIAVDNGFSGTVEQWLDSLHGRDGRDGDDGLDGAPGRDGRNGSNGKSAYELALSLGYSGTLEQWLQALKGRDGNDGAPGNDGNDGVGIASMRVEDDGTITFIYTDGGTWNTGVSMRGPKGDPGEVTSGQLNELQGNLSLALQSNNETMQAVMRALEGFGERLGGIEEGMRQYEPGANLGTLDERLTNIEKTVWAMDGSGSGGGSSGQSMIMTDELGRAYIPAGIEGGQQIWRRCDILFDKDMNAWTNQWSDEKFVHRDGRFVDTAELGE